MTQGNVSNMRRVIHLPEKILEKVDQGRITFTQGLIILDRLEYSEELMLTASEGETGKSKREVQDANS